jgi:hypothetical protein
VKGDTYSIYSPCSSSGYSSFAATSRRIPLAANTSMGPNIAPLSVPTLATGVSEV